MVSHGIAEFPAVHASHGEHECRRLRDTLFIAIIHLGPCTVQNVAVSGTVHDGLGEYHFPALLGVNNHALALVAFHNHVSSKDIEQHFHAAFFHYLPREVLGSLRVHHCKAHVQRTFSVMCGLASFSESLHETQRQTFDYFIALAAQEAEKRKADGHVASKIASAVNEHDLGSLYKCCSLGSHNSGRAGTDYEDVNFLTYRKFLRRFQISFHFV